MDASREATRGLPDHSVVTGQAVRLDIVPVSPFLRMLACVIDMAALMIATALFLWALVHMELNLSASLQRVLMILTVAGVLFIIPAGIEAASRGRSLGKWIMGIQVVRDDGGPITTRHALVRWATAPLEIWASVGGVAFVVVMFQPRGKRLGDLAAGTTVIKARAAKPPKPLPVPPRLESWARVAVIVPPPRVLSDNTRAFVRQQMRLVPAARRQGAMPLAAQLYPYVNPKPPEGTPPEEFVTAVVALMREKTTARLLQQFDEDSRRRQQVLAVPWGL